MNTGETALPVNQTGIRLDDTDIPAPPPTELNELLDLAMRGDMFGVEQWADELAVKDARYISFARRLKELAGNFKTKSILALVIKKRGEDI